VASEDQPGEYLQVRAYWVDDDNVTMIAQALGPYVRGEAAGEVTNGEPDVSSTPDDMDP
jgi:hypothetical protein